MLDVCILGGGAAGMAVAADISMNCSNLKIALIEKKEDLGLKLKATGNGRCNISNIQCETFEDTVKFFKKVGVEIKCNDDGWAYPVSEDGSDVVAALKDRMKTYGVQVHLKTVVEKIEIGENSEAPFTIICTNGKIYQSKRLIMALGGKAAPNFGTVGDGFILSKKLGHKITKLAPCLVPIICENKELGNNKGIRCKGMVSLYRHGEFVESQKGEIQFIKEGLSGICVFSLSRHLVLNDKTKFEDYKLKIDFLEQYQNSEIFTILKERCNIKGMLTEKLLSSIVKDDIGKKILKNWSDKVKYAKNLTDADIKEIISHGKNIIYNVTGAGGWKEAQCTTGGVSWDDFNWDTMESKICPGMYFVGEIIDYSGPCGGYNLENAWVTARKVSKAICTEFTN